MIEIEFIGTGGQGSVVAGKLFADAASKAGYVAQAFSAYGAQRRGGNVESYVRLSRETIRDHSRIYGADYVVVMDKNLLERSQKEGKIRKGVTVVINAAEPPDAFPSLGERDVFTIDANRIASRHKVTLPSGMPVINTTVLGALWAMIPSVQIEELNAAFEDAKLPGIERNKAAALEAFQAIQKWMKVPGKRPELVDETPVVVDLLPEYHPRLPPCEANCPAGEKIERTALLVQYSEFTEALENIRTENPFPGICGRVCFHPCETNCNRVQFDEGVATNSLERAAFDFADLSRVRKPVKRNATGKTVAIVGSGPAGMSCAHYLCLLGHSVTVFEAQRVAGGVPRLGIPAYHLPREIVDLEIKQIQDLGVDIKLNTAVGRDVTFESLAKSFDACFIAVGAHRSATLNISGEENKGVLPALDLLKQVALGEKVEVGERVVVVGGGNVAMDAARTARRLGATTVYAVCLEQREEMPAYSWEIEDAEAEGVLLQCGWGPKEIVTDGEKIVALEFKRCVSVYDGQKRFVPKYDSTSSKLECDTVITAIGDRVDVPWADSVLKMSGGLIETDKLGRTSKAGVFAGGDASSLSRTVVEAIASGKRAAMGIDMFIRGETPDKATPFWEGRDGTVSMGRYLSGDVKNERDDVVRYDQLNLHYFEEKPRKKARAVPVKTRIRSFKEARSGLSEEAAGTEAERCFHCGTCFLCEVCYISCPELAVTLTDEGPTFSNVTDVCKSCGICIHECPRHALSWEGAE